MRPNAKFLYKVGLNYCIIKKPSPPTTVTLSPLLSSFYYPTRKRLRFPEILLPDLASIMAVLLSLLLFLALTGYSSATYCLCKDGAGDQALQKTIDYACGAGADCSTILQNGACYNPNTVKAHCDWAANSYFQKKGQSSGSCDFSGTATISANPPSTVATGCTYPASASTGGTSTTTPTTGTTTPTTGTTTPTTGTTTPTTGTNTPGATPTTTTTPSSVFGTGLGPSGSGAGIYSNGAASFSFKGVNLFFASMMTLRFLGLLLGWA